MRKRRATILAATASKARKNELAFLCLLVGLSSLRGTSEPAFAHPGGTDSSGCHHCRTNCAKWGYKTGQYHCHGGRTVYVPRDRKPVPPPPPSKPVRVLPEAELPAEAPLPENSIVLREAEPERVPATQVEVLSVVDGDTFVARQGERLYLMKLRDLEAPELEQPHGRVARDRLAARIAGERLVVWAGKGGCVVPVRAKTGDGVDLTVWMLKQGLAWASREAATGWRKLEEQARMRKVGLWADRTPEPPWTFRRRMAASEQ